MQFVTRCAGCASVVLAAALSPLAAPLAAQGSTGPQGVRVEVSLVHATFDSDNPSIRTIKPSFGFDVVVAFHLDEHFVLAGGVQSTRQSATDSTADETSIASQEQLAVTELFAEPRYMFLPSSRIQPYLLLRLGYFRTSGTVARVDDAGESVTGNEIQDGSALGGGVGVSMQVWRRINVNAVALWQKISMGNAQLEGDPELGSGLSGKSLVIRFGASMDFGAAASPLRTLLGR